MGPHQKIGNSMAQPNSIAEAPPIPTGTVAPEGAHEVDFTRWLIVGLLGLGAIIAYCDRTNISAALAYKPFAQHFQLSDIDRGVLNSAFFWSYMLLQIPAGWLVDRYGTKIPYAVSFALWCVSSAVTGMTRTLPQLTTLRVITGAGEAIVTPASFRWMR